MGCLPLLVLSVDGRNCTCPHSQAFVPLRGHSPLRAERHGGVSAKPTQPLLLGQGHFPVCSSASALGKSIGRHSGKVVDSVLKAWACTWALSLSPHNSLGGCRVAPEAHVGWGPLSDAAWSVAGFLPQDGSEGRRRVTLPLHQCPRRQA